MMTMYPTIPTVLKDGTEPISYAHDGDAGLDLCATEDVTLYPGQWKMVGSGVSMAIPKGFVGLVTPRSGLGCKGLVLKNTLGIIDAGYRGEIKMPLYNNNPTHVWVRTWEEVHAAKPNVEGTIHVRKGDRVAQLLIVPVSQATLVACESLDETERNVKGFGSTGVGRL